MTRGGPRSKSRPTSRTGTQAQSCWRRLRRRADLLVMGADGHTRLRSWRWSAPPAMSCGRPRCRCCSAAEAPDPARMIEEEPSMTTGLAVFDTTVQETICGSRVSSRVCIPMTGISPTPRCATLHALRDRLRPEHAVHLAAQLRKAAAQLGDALPLRPDPALAALVGGEDLVGELRARPAAPAPSGGPRPPRGAGRRRAAGRGRTRRCPRTASSTRRGRAPRRSWSTAWSGGCRRRSRSSRSRWRPSGGRRTAARPA